ncbi:hypothetical protein P9112_009247 [Eukaryota sp. TZLM1-RC]
MFSKTGFPFSEPLVASLNKHFSFDNPTLVQARSFAPITQGRDVLIKSSTGSGKSLAFLLPIIDHVLNSKTDRSDGIHALILSPTRELALQLQTVANTLLNGFAGITCGSVTGGEKRKSEKARIRKGVHILIATPGRLRDHFEHTCSLLDRFNKLKFVVLDEADQLLDLGFLPSIRFFLESTKGIRMQNYCQTVLVSATLTNKVSSLASFALRNPINIYGDDEKNNENESFFIPSTLHQSYIIIPTKIRLAGLASVIYNEIEKAKAKKEAVRIIAFVFSCVHVDFYHTIFQQLSADLESPFRAFSRTDFFALHGNLDMIERKKTLRRFHDSDHSSVMFATDVAARGLDIEDVSSVILFDPPSNVESYVHRIGRGGRIGNAGRSVLVLNPHEEGYVELLENETGTTINLLPLEHQINSLASRVLVNKLPRREARWEYFARLVNNYVDEQVKKDRPLMSLAMQSYQAYVSAYSTFPKESRSIFNRNSLHLGHLCKSFGLSETPQSIATTLRKDNSGGGSGKRRTGGVGSGSNKRKRS